MILETEPLGKLERIVDYDLNKYKTNQDEIITLGISPENKWVLRSS